MPAVVESSASANAQAAFDSGLAHQRSGANSEAVEQYRRAIAFRPDWAEPHNNLGVLLDSAGELEGAIRHLRLAASLKPDYIDAYVNLGNLMRRQRQLCAAIACYDHALALDPSQSDIRWNRGIALLTAGRLREGFADYEHGLYCGMRKPRGLHVPQWDGRYLGGRPILVYAEQGFGDTIQFARYLPAVRERGGYVILECQSALKGLLERSGLADEVVTPRESEHAIGRCAGCISLLSLPAVLETDIGSIPAVVPYLAADPARQRDWSERLGGLQGLKVGIAWAGNPSHPNDQNRSLFLTDILPVIELPGLSAVSLQIGPAARELDASAMSGRIFPTTDQIHDFEDTAALIASLDLVLSVDTAVAHLAGALGKAVRTLLPWMPDWRWMLDREDSPWYPSMRLFRQDRPGDWTSAIETVCRDLCKPLP